jgi:hypothetical protein
MRSVKSCDRPCAVRDATIYNKKNFDDDVITKILTERRGEYMFTLSEGKHIKVYNLYYEFEANGRPTGRAISQENPPIQAVFKF